MKKTQCSLSLERVRVYNDERERKYGKIEDVYTFLFKREKRAFMRVIADIFRVPYILDGPRVKLVTECIQTCTPLLTNDVRNSQIFHAYIRAVPELKLMDDIGPQLKERTQSNSVPIGPENNNSTEGFVYDFFVSHSHKDADWVLSRLVADLESAFTDDDVVLRGCIADRDFEPVNDSIFHDGISRLESLISELEKEENEKFNVSCKFKVVEEDGKSMFSCSLCNKNYKLGDFGKKIQNVKFHASSRGHLANVYAVGMNKEFFCLIERMHIVAAAKLT
ncbi:CD282 [Mytilus edulis]|uniref:TLR2 n=1 Tax=Mytilus edulis TaxID=6550 RepID=A0A8S3TY18_MYTED|nr:CD282 [Mytilus edulis]